MNPYPEYDVMAQVTSPTATSPPQHFTSLVQHQVQESYQIISTKKYITKATVWNSLV